MSFGSFVLLPNITGLVTSPNIRATGCLIQRGEENDTHHKIPVNLDGSYPELALTHLFQTQSTAILRQFSLDH